MLCDCFKSQRRVVHFAVPSSSRKGREQRAAVAVPGQEGEVGGEGEAGAPRAGEGAREAEHLELVGEVAEEVAALSR